MRKVYACSLEILQEPVELHTARMLQQVPILEFLNGRLMFSGERDEKDRD